MRVQWRPLCDLISIFIFDSIEWGFSTLFLIRIRKLPVWLFSLLLIYWSIYFPIRLFCLYRVCALCLYIYNDDVYSLPEKNQSAQQKTFTNTWTLLTKHFFACLRKYSFKKDKYKYMLSANSKKVYFDVSRWRRRFSS